MGHDATKVQLGVPQSSFRVIENHNGTIDAGKVVRLKSDDTISIASADGLPLGISVGVEQSGIGRTCICKKGTRVPLMLTDGFTPTVGAQVAIHNTTGLGATKDGSSTYVNAIYSSGLLTGITEAGAEVDAAYIDMPGGL